MQSSEKQLLMNQGGLWLFLQMTWPWLLEPLGLGTNEDRPGYVKVYYREGNGLSWTQLGPNIDGVTNGLFLMLAKH